MSTPEEYNKLLTEIVKKQMDILGPDIAVRKAKNISAIKISDDGEVSDIHGDPQEVLRQLVDEYISLSGEIVKNILGPVFAKYPNIKLEIK